MSLSNMAASFYKQTLELKVCIKVVSVIQRYNTVIKGMSVSVCVCVCVYVCVCMCVYVEVSILLLYQALEHEIIVKTIRIEI